jgi:hypothetical protein
MKVKIVRLNDNETVDASIIKGKGFALPSLTEGWRFNIKKHARRTDFQTFVLVTDKSPDVIEGCVIFKMKDFAEPYMAYIEVAPHNRGIDKLYDHVAGCMIAFACRLSFIHGVGHFRGWLAFDVIEQHKEDEIRLMSIYCQKYGALRWGETTMVISPEAGENLINRYLNLGNEKQENRT